MDIHFLRLDSSVLCVIEWRQQFHRMEDILDHGAFVTTVRSSKPGQHVKITFKPGRDSIMTLARLTRAYCGRSGVDIAEDDKLIAEAVVQGRNWGSKDENRTVAFVGLRELDDNTLYQLGRDIESVAVV